MRCPNCYNELPVEVTSCPSCTFPLAAHFQAPAVVKAPEPAVAAGPRVVVEPSAPVLIADDQPAEDHVGDAVEQAPHPAVVEGDAATVSANGQAGPQYLNGATPQKKTAYGLPMAERPARPVPSKARPQVKRKAVAKEDKGPSRSAAAARIVLAVVVLAAVGIYVFMFTDLFQRRVSGRTAQLTLTSFRNLPSNIGGMTIDQAATAELEHARKAGQLGQYRGWVSKPIQGERSKVLVVFWFTEKDKTEHSAEWEVDVTNNTATPRTDWAKAIYSGAPQGGQK